MANDVTTYIQFQTIGESGVAKLKELVNKLDKTNASGLGWFSDMWGVDPEISDTYSWNFDNIGPKWTYIDEVGDDYMRLVSAWDFPEMGLTWLFRQLGEVDSTVLGVATYEDEATLFVGTAVFTKDGLFDREEWDYDAIEEGMYKLHPELQTLDRDSAEYDDIWHGGIWDYIWSLQNDHSTKVVEAIKN